MPTSKSYTGYVYLIGSERYGWYKIGKSINPDIRVQDLGILLPFKVDLYGLWGTGDHSRLESSFHREYQPYNINGEWFTFPAEVVEEILISYPPYFADRIFPLSIGETRIISSSPREDYDLTRMKISRVWAQPSKEEPIPADPEQPWAYGREYYSVFSGAVQEALRLNPHMDKKTARSHLKPAVRGLWCQPMDIFAKALDNAIKNLKGSVARNAETGLNSG